MQFQPKSEEEVNRFPLITKGEYDFTVHAAKDKQSKQGNDMIELNIELWEGEKSLGRVFDYLLDEMPAKLRHFCDTVGMLAEYETGTVSASKLEGKAGRVRIGIKKATAEYPEKNFVEDYVCRPAKAIGAKSGSPTAVPVTEEKEDLPF